MSAIPSARAATSLGLRRSMLVIGGAQAAGIVISILRMKVLAVLLGPAGVGLLSLYQNLQSSIVTVAGLGIGSSGVREIASHGEDPATQPRVRRVLLLSLLVQGLLAAAAV